MEGGIMRCLIMTCTLALAGCASTYQLTLMPRDSGKLYSGVLEDVARGEGRISVTIEGKAYNGTWVESAPAYAQGWVTGGLGFRRGWSGLGGSITLDNPQGGEAKALLTASDGSGLRCDFRNSHTRGGGLCRDDKGREYDVQMRLAEKR
jgi:hypothetical protein